MLLRYKVTLSGIKGFFRIYLVSGDTTLYRFHKQLRADLEFPQDQLILFKGLSADEQVVGRYGLFDLGSGAVDAVTLAETLERGVTHFVYFYDVTNRKSVNITFEAEAEEGGRPSAIVLLESKGPVPAEFENGYVAYEDLPDAQRHLPGEKPKPVFAEEDDFDEDEEDEDDADADGEDGEEIFEEGLL